jgi:BMFP domain-containing protein YqiC
VFDLRNVEAAVERIAALLPDDARVLREEFKASLKPLVESMLARMDLVTREEFDAQSRVLATTRARLEALEAALADLERERDAST